MWRVGGQGWVTVSTLTNYTSDARIRVLIADDYPIVRNGLRLFLLAYNDLELVGEAANGEQAVKLCRQLNPDVVLLDLLMPVMGGLRATRVIHHYCPQTQIIILTTTGGEDKLVQHALHEGARYCLSKNVSAAQLAETIRLAAGHGASSFFPATPQNV